MRVGIGRFGTLGYEAASQLSALGIGASTSVGIGGDPINGSSFGDHLARFENDDDTDAVIMIGESGGPREAEGAVFVQQQLSKPLVASIAGLSAPKGRKMGHAGAIVSGVGESVQEKVAILEAAGVRVAPDPSSIGTTMAALLGECGLAPAVDGRPWPGRVCRDHIHGLRVLADERGVARGPVGSGSMSIDDDRLRTLLDRAEIHDVLMRYCRGVDRGDVELLRTVYHLDSVDDHGYWSGPGQEFGEFIVGRLASAALRTTHAVANELIELDGDTARVETYVFAYLWRAIESEENAEALDVFAGRYVDLFARREGVWRIASRRVVHDWSCTPQVLPPALGLPLDAFVQGRRDRSDPCYGAAG